MKEEKFKVINFIRELIIYLDKYLENFPKKDIEIKNRIKNISYNILELTYKANKGKSRFSWYAFAGRVTCETVANSSCQNVAYSISINAENKNVYDISEPTPIDADTGTVVTITGIDNLHQEDMSYEVLAECLLKTFAWYLYLNRNSIDNYMDLAN